MRKGKPIIFFTWQNRSWNRNILKRKYVCQSEQAFMATHQTCYKYFLIISSTIINSNLSQPCLVSILHSFSAFFTDHKMSNPKLDNRKSNFFSRLSANQPPEFSSWLLINEISFYSNWSRPHTQNDYMTASRLIEKLFLIVSSCRITAGPRSCSWIVE